MRFDLGLALVLSALGAVGVAACGSSSSPAAPADSGAILVCESPLATVVAADSIACPTDSSGNFLSYNQAIEQTCASYKLKTGDLEYGPCFEYLVFQVDADSSGHNFSRCFYDPTTHAFVGVIYADGSGMQDQCGTTSWTVAAGSFDPTCSISGFQGGGAVFESCAPVLDAGSEAMLLGQ